MEYTPDCIIETDQGLFLADSFLKALLDRVDQLDRAGREADAKALFQEFNLPARA